MLDCSARCVWRDLFGDAGEAVGFGGVCGDLWVRLGTGSVLRHPVDRSDRLILPDFFFRFRATGAADA